MGALITIIGNVGAGKTSLARVLQSQFGIYSALEQHHERPFQALFASDLHRYALANQFDYLLLRAEQEQQARQQQGITVQDGGLDEDFWIFTRLFHERGYLQPIEYQLCQRLYSTIRQTNPEPELAIWLDVPVASAIERQQHRNRSLEIAQATDIQAIDALLHSWLDIKPPPTLLKLDSTHTDYTYTDCLPEIETALKKIGAI